MRQDMPPARDGRHGTFVPAEGPLWSLCHSRGVTDELALSLAVAAAGTEARSLVALRERVVELVLAEVPADAAVLHALSPRVPLETAVVRGLSREALAASALSWDETAVTLQPLRARATELDGVARDTDAFPLGSPSRARFEAVITLPTGMHFALIAHLVVRGRIIGALVLFRARPSGGFSDAEAALLRRLAPVIAVADALHQALDGAPSGSVPTRLRCEDQRLTRRQREIVEHVAMGHTNEAIARALGVSANTLRNHLAEVFRRLDAANRADVVRLSVLR